MAGSGCSSGMSPWEGLHENKHDKKEKKCLYCVDGESRFPGSPFFFRIH